MAGNNKYVINHNSKVYHLAKEGVDGHGDYAWRSICRQSETGWDREQHYFRGTGSPKSILVDEIPDGRRLCKHCAEIQREEKTIAFAKRVVRRLMDKTNGA